MVKVQSLIMTVVPILEKYLNAIACVHGGPLPRVGREDLARTIATLNLTHGAEENRPSLIGEGARGGKRVRVCDLENLKKAGVASCDGVFAAFGSFLSDGVSVARWVFLSVVVLAQQCLLVLCNTYGSASLSMMNLYEAVLL